MNALNFLFAIVSLPIAVLMWIIAHWCFQDGEKGQGAWYTFLGFFNFFAWVLNVLVVTGVFK